MARARKAKSDPAQATPAEPLLVGESASLGVLGEIGPRIGLGLLRLGTEGRPAEADAVALIHNALDAGVRLLDTADSYCLSGADFHYGERLARQAVDTWKGPTTEVRILTKVGLTRPSGRWIPDGRPEHLRRSVLESLQALRVERLFALLLHARDPQVPFEETLACLAELQKQGHIEHLGLCNTSVGEIRQAQRHFPVALVQNELNILTRKSANEGVVELARREKIPFLAHRPLAGHAKVEKLAKNRVVNSLAKGRGLPPLDFALAALLDVGPHVVPLVGATRLESLQASLRACLARLAPQERSALEEKYPFALEPEFAPLLEIPARVAPLTKLPANAGPGADPEVVLLMGIQGAGKSERVAQYVEHGYARLNRDDAGGSLEDLIPRLRELLSAGQKRVVLDNTYPTRLSRSLVVAAAHAAGVPVRCVHLKTPPADAYINIVSRILQRHGRLLGPEDLKELGKSDPNLPPPAAVSRWIKSYEAPGDDEGFSAIDEVPFFRRPNREHTQRGLLLDVDGTLRKSKLGELYPRSPEDVEILPNRREVLQRWVEQGYQLFFVSNQSGIASEKVTDQAVRETFEHTARELGVPIREIAYCPHPAFPVGCFCRKPLPGLGVWLMERYQLAREQTLMVGDMDSDAEFARGLGIGYVDADAFFADTSV